MGAMAIAAGAEQMPLPVMQRIAGGRRVEETSAGYRAETPAEAAGGEQHARIPDAVLYCAALPVGSRLLYGLLQRHMGRDGCFPSVRRLAAELGVSARSVETWLAALIESGAVSIDVAGGGRRSNRYLLTGTARSVANAATQEAPRSVANSATQRSKKCYAPMQNLPQSHSHVAKANLAKDSAPTERRATGPQAASKVAAANGTRTPPSEQPARGKNVPAPRKRASDEPGNALAAVIDGIRAAGARLVLEAGKDGKAVASVLSGSDVTAADVVACYVAIARGEYGDDFARRNLSIGYVCGARCMTGYLVWRESGGKAGGNPAAGRDGGTARTRAAPAARGANPQHLRHAERLDW